MPNHSRASTAARSPTAASETEFPPADGLADLHADRHQPGIEPVRVAAGGELEPRAFGVAAARDHAHRQRDQGEEDEAAAEHQAGRHRIVAIGKPNEGRDAQEATIAAVEATTAMSDQTTI